MTIPDFTIVLGVDLDHFAQLTTVWPTWMKHKPSLWNHPLIIFYDREEMGLASRVTTEKQWPEDHPDYRWISWPPPGVTYPVGHDKFSDQQRHKMLAGFVHVAAEYVRTPYWLKLDTDTVAVGCKECGGLGHVPNDIVKWKMKLPCRLCVGTGNTDDWIDPEWFESPTHLPLPGIVAHPWGFTKPADQMMKLDEWVFQNGAKRLNGDWYETPPLNIKPKSPESSRVSHNRIISWCGFFNTELTQRCADAATKTMGEGRLPVPSQDGFMFYAAERLGYPIVRVNMKQRGWRHKSSMRGIRKAVEESMI